MVSAVKRDQLGSQAMKAAVEKGPLTVGSQERAVAYLERALQVVGFDPGTKDNKFTKETARAVKEFQTAWGLKATGELDAKTFAKLDHTLGRARKHGSGCPDCNKAGFQGAVGLGQKNQDVYTAEQRLKKLGYDVGKVDGVFDRQTEAATKAFKRDQKSKSTNGLISKDAFAALGKEARAVEHAPYRRRLTKGADAHKRLNAATAEAAAKTNADGSKGIGEGAGKRAIQNVQRHLKAAGYDPKRADGVWDERTEQALRIFQKKAGLPDTGRVGTNAWKELSKSFFVAKDGTSPGQRVGERSAAVLRSEKLLKKIGFKVKADGVFDRETLKASRAFEKRFPGMGKDGVIGEGQLERMKQVAHAKEDPGSGPMLKKGFRGTPVKRLQARLDKLGFANGANDGVFGAKTASAVKKFQRAFGLKADGVVGKGTWRMLGIDVKGAVKKPGQVSGGGSVTSGGGWGGSENVANAAKQIAASMGAPVTSQKRNYADTIRVGSSTASDHYTGNTGAFAVDFGVSGARGDQLARAIATKYGIPHSYIGTYNGKVVNIGGANYRLQLLWRVSGHFDHVHFGIRRV